jgi:hypothetical protein
MFSERHREYRSVYRHIPRMGAADRYNWPSHLFEQAEQLLGNEARPCGIEVTIARGMLAVNEETLWHDQMQIILCADHAKRSRAIFSEQHKTATGSDPVALCEPKLFAMPCLAMNEGADADHGSLDLWSRVLGRGTLDTSVAGCGSLASVD